MLIIFLLKILRFFKNHLIDIIVSYNAFVNTMNLEVTKDKSVDFSED